MAKKQQKSAEHVPPIDDDEEDEGRVRIKETPIEIGGRKEGNEATRYGDWEKNGRAIDF